MRIKSERFAMVYQLSNQSLTLHKKFYQRGNTVNCKTMMKTNMILAGIGNSNSSWRTNHPLHKVKTGTGIKDSLADLMLDIGQKKIEKRFFFIICLN